jgi:hypothetical protein
VGPNNLVNCAGARSPGFNLFARRPLRTRKTNTLVQGVGKDTLVVGVAENKLPQLSPIWRGGVTLRSLPKRGGKGRVGANNAYFLAFLVLPDRIELSTSPLPRECLEEGSERIGGALARHSFEVCPTRAVCACRMLVSLPHENLLHCGLA